MRKFFKEFKEFICRGNVFDMAVGLIIATAFNKIVSSMVNDILMPLVTWATGAASLADLSIVLRRDAAGVPTLTWAYGNFIQTVIDFLIVALSIFLMVKLVNGYRKRAEEAHAHINKRDNREVYMQLKAKAKAENRKLKVVIAEYEAEQEALKKAEEAKKAEAEKLAHPGEEALLIEIRDLLKNQPTKAKPAKETKPAAKTKATK